MLRLCPFGRVLLAYQKEAIRLEPPLYIFIGKKSKEFAYAYKKWGTLCSFLPFEDDYFKYEWPVDGQKLIIFDTGDFSRIMLKKFCYHLQKISNPRVIFVHSEKHHPEIYNQKRVKNG